MKIITRMSKAGKDLLAQWEGGHELTAYKDVAGVWTLSVGCTYYPSNKKKIQPGDTISLEESEKMFDQVLKTFEAAVNSMTRDDINQNQFDALVACCYNIGIGGMQGSTLLKRVNKNPDDPTIADAFMMWVYAGGKVVNGLVNRRKKEIALYFKPTS
jgi:lysozyme